MYEYTTPHKSRKVPESIKDKAISLLIENPTNSQKTALSAYIDKTFGKLDCCVLYALSQDFRNLCEQLNIDLGKKEVVINQGYTVLYTPDYVVPPSMARV